MSNQNFLARRTQMALVACGLWVFLLFWSVSAFWQHIDELGATYRGMSKAGALASEFALLALILFHCFDKHIGVRKWALILGFLLAALILAHAGALRGMAEATTAQLSTEQRTRDALTAMSKEQQAAVTTNNTGTQRERLAKEGKAKAAQAQIAKSAQEQVAATIAKSADKVKDDSILPRWYLDGWMYSVIFIAGILFVSIIFGLMMRDDVDANFDGIPDKQQAVKWPTELDVNANGKPGKN